MQHTLPQPLRRWFFLQGLFLLLAFLVLLPARAQSEERAERDPPTRVARVAELQGEALWFDPEQREWQPVLRNQTLAEGDRLRLNAGARLGLRIGVHGFWLDDRAQLEIRRLDDDEIALDLDQGALALRFATRDAAQQAVVRTQDGRFRFERSGAYRIDQLPRASRAQVFEGRLRFDRRGDELPPVYVEEDEQAELWWDGGPRAERGRLMTGRDDFGRFLLASLGFGDRGYANWNERPSHRYVSSELTGADELDANGRWEVSAEYGPIWTPLRVAVDWAPYREGRWTWSRHWGWTWVDDLPWGYATSHYGRWVYVRNRWCWTPGARIVARPVFAPALVAWVGGGNVSIGIQIGGRAAPPVAWVPLSPYENYRPWYRHSPRYGKRIDPDPITVRRPAPGVAPHWRGVPGAVSTVVAGGPRPVPLRDEVRLRELRPLPQAPSRDSGLPLAQPPRMAQPGQRGPRGESRDPREARGAEGLPLAQPRPLPAPAPFARVEEESPRVRAGGGSGNLPLREAAPVAVPQPEPRREEQGRFDNSNVPLRQERQERVEQPRQLEQRQELPRWERPEPRVERQDRAERGDRRPMFDAAPHQRQRDEGVPLRQQAPQQQAPMMAPRPAPPQMEAPRRAEPQRQEQRPPAPRQEPRRERDNERQDQR